MKASYEMVFVPPSEHGDDRDRGDKMTRVCSTWFGVPVRHAATDNFTLRIVLPEGAHSPRLAKGSLPLELDTVSVETEPARRGSLLYALGVAHQPLRSVLVLSKRQIVWEHYQAFAVEYELDGAGGFWMAADWVSSACLFPLLLGGLLALPSLFLDGGRLGEKACLFPLLGSALALVVSLAFNSFSIASESNKGKENVSLYKSLLIGPFLLHPLRCI